MTPEQKTSILIVDDDEVYRTRLARAFVDRGYDVRTAHDYDSAVAVAQADSPELAVVDLKMPGKSGLELVQALREIDPSTKTVVLTGYGSIATAIDAVRLGATYYLSKPADADDIVAAFARAEAPPLEPSADHDYKAPSLARAEWEHINRVLSDAGGNISEAARRLGIHRRSLQRKLQKYPPNK
ncbi:MAG: response regulator [Deltaproteobacteria bacterium]|nr:response regulator [Deltaproteobacteria bacterium]